LIALGKRETVFTKDSTRKAKFAVWDGFGANL